MREADREQFARLMAMLAEVYGSMTALKLSAYWVGLLSHDIRDIEAAVRRCLETRRSRDGYPAHWPTPGDLIALMYRELEGVPDPPARSKRKALPEAPQDPGVRDRIRAMIRGVIDSLPDRRPTMETPAVATQTGPPRSRQQTLDEFFAKCGSGQVGQWSALALRAGYGSQEIAEAIRRVQPEGGTTDAGEKPDTEPWT